MEDQRLKVEEVAAILGENRNIVRNWLRDFREWIQIEKAENGYNVFPPVAVEQMKLIRHLIRERGFSTRQVSHHLATGGEIPSATVVVPNELDELKESIRQMAAAQEQQNEKIVKLLEEQNRRLADRDKQFTQFLTERREEQAAKQLPDPSPESRPWWKFWD